MRDIERALHSTIVLLTVIHIELYQTSIKPLHSTIVLLTVNVEEYK